MMMKSEQLWRYKKEYDNIVLIENPTMEEYNRLLDLEDLIWEIEDERDKV